MAIDAFAFKSFASVAMTPNKYPQPNNEKNEIIYNNGFIVLMIPLNFHFPIKILHIEKSTTGNYNAIIEKIVSDIKKVLINNDIKVWFQATDGDRYLSIYHENFYNNYVKGKSSNFFKLIFDIYNKISKDPKLLIPVGDLLHLWKSVRSRYLKNFISLFANSLSATDCEVAKLILDIEKALDDVSSAGKMRDIYVMKLFTFENVCKLLKSGLFVDSCLLFPFACWIVADFSITIDLQFRLFLIELSFQFISTFRENICGLKQNGILQKANETSNTVTIHEEQYTLRMMNSLIATAIALLFSTDYVRIDGVGTHLVENNIGLARQTSSDPRWERIITTFAHTEIRKNIARNYGFKLHNQGRINDGGCKVDERMESQSPPGELISKPDSWTIVRIIQLFSGLCNSDVSNAFTQECNDFVDELEQMGSLIKLKKTNINETANSGIIARLISFKSEKDED